MQAPPHHHHILPILYHLPILYTHSLHHSLAITHKLLSLFSILWDVFKEDLMLIYVVTSFDEEFGDLGRVWEEVLDGVLGGIIVGVVH
jgi:hypothetical protein